MILVNKIVATLITVAVLFTFAPTRAEALFWSSEAAIDDLQLILRDMELNGERPENIKKLKKFVSTFPKSPVTDEALLRLGRIYLKEDNYAVAALEFQKLLDIFPESKFRNDALFNLGYSHHRQGMGALAKQELEDVIAATDAAVTLKVKAKIIVETLSYLDDKPDGEFKGILIGAALPLEGIYSSFGERALRGILLASDIFGQASEKKSSDTEGIEVTSQSKGSLQIEVVVEDVGENPDDAALVVNSFYKNKKLIGIVGPLLSKTSETLAKRAEKKRVPTVLLSKKKDITETGDYIFRNFLTYKNQASLMAKVGHNVFRYKRYAILYPQNNYGIELAKEFTEAIITLGGDIVSEVSYEEDQQDFGNEVIEIFGIEVEEHMEGRRNIREYTSTLDIDAIFIPDYPEVIAQITPFLAYYNVKDVQLLGSNGWNSHRTAELGGAHVEGAIFADGFFAGSEREATRTFIDRYKEVYGEEPGVLAAEAFDAANLLITSVYHGARNRKGVIKYLRELEEYEGVTGTVSFNEEGDAIKKLFMLTILNGKISEIEYGEEEIATPDYDITLNSPDFTDGEEGEVIYDEEGNIMIIRKAPTDEAPPVPEDKNTVTDPNSAPPRAE